MNQKCHVLMSQRVLSSHVTLVRGFTEDILDMPFLIHECDMTHSNMRRDSLMDVGRHEFVGVWWHCWSLFATRRIDVCEYVSFANEALHIEFFCGVNIGLLFGVYIGHLWGSFAREETQNSIVTRRIYVCEHDSFVCRYGVSMWHENSYTCGAVSSPGVMTTLLQIIDMPHSIVRHNSVIHRYRVRICDMKIRRCGAPRVWVWWHDPSWIMTWLNHMCEHDLFIHRRGVRADAIRSYRDATWVPAGKCVPNEHMSNTPLEMWD